MAKASTVPTAKRPPWRSRTPTDDARAAQSYFADKADAYRTSPTHANPADLARMVSWLQPKPGMRALDVATGGGHTAHALAGAGCSVVAYDATRAMVTGALAHLSPVVGDALALPFASASFDIVASRIAPHHFADLRKFCREAARVLRPGGALYVFDLTTPSGTSARTQADAIDAMERLRDPSHRHSWSPAEWRVALTGWTTERMETPATEMDLEPWIARAQMPAEKEAELRKMLAAKANLAGYGLTADGKMRVLRVEILARRS